MQRIGTRVMLVAGVLALVVSACSGSDSTTTTTTASTTTVAVDNTTTDAAAPVVDTTFSTQQGQPFSEPPVLRSEGGVLSTTFDVAPTTFEVAGAQVKGMSYQGQLLGPTLLVSPGDTIRIQLDNALDEETNFHTHGLHVSPEGDSDNVLRVMEPDSDNQIEIVLPQDVAPGTYWYHAHLHGLTEPQVFGGLAGALVVNGLTERLPADLQAVPEHLIGLKDLQLDDSGAIVSKDIDSNAPTTRTVNGLVNPVLSAQPGGTQLLRLANMSADIWYRLKLDGTSFTVLAEDANPLSAVTTEEELLLPPGKRFDVLVRWDEAGTYKLRTLRYQTGPSGDQYPERVLATVAVAGDAVTPVDLPTTMGPSPDLADAPVAQVRDVTFSENTKDGTFMINGEEFDMDKVTYTMQLNTVEEWRIRNTSDEEHPFHIHVNDFQVMSIDGKDQPPNSLQDIVRLPAKGEVVIRMRLTDFVGKYVFHCHILNHEDNGMMAIVEVTEDGTPSAATAGTGSSTSHGDGHS
jgi:FtsP/CotA-like multicopper oxidase with cupredoxin domain